MANELAEITRALSAPLGEFIAAVGRGVAEAQQALDLHTLETFKAVHSSKVYEELRLVGYQPTWYRIPEVSAEIYVTLSASGREQLQRKALPGEGTTTMEGSAGGIRLYATPIDAGYSNTFGYDIRACSQLKFRVVPVPPTAQAEGIKVVPDLRGKPYAEAEAMLQQLGIAYRTDFYEPAGNETVEKTEPGAGAILAAGQVLMLTIAIKPA